MQNFVSHGKLLGTEKEVSTMSSASLYSLDPKQLSRLGIDPPNGLRTMSFQAPLLTKMGFINDIQIIIAGAIAECMNKEDFEGANEVLQIYLRAAARVFLR